MEATSWDMLGIVVVVLQAYVDKTMEIVVESNKTCNI